MTRFHNPERTVVFNASIHGHPKRDWEDGTKTCQKPHIIKPPSAHIAGCPHAISLNVRD